MIINNENDIISIVQNGRDIIETRVGLNLVWQAGNFLTSDGGIFQTSDGDTFNVKNT